MPASKKAPARVAAPASSDPPLQGRPRSTLSVSDVIAARTKAAPAAKKPAPAPKRRVAPAPPAPAPIETPIEEETPVEDHPASITPMRTSAGPPRDGPRPMRLKGRTGGPRFELAGDLAARLYDHQRDGVRWMWNLQLQNRGGILADDMGLGKTLQVAAFASGLLRSKAAKRFLVLAPTTLLPHWHKEFIVAGLTDGVNLHKFAGGGSKAERDRALSRVETHGGVLLTTYGMVLHNDTALGAPSSEDDAERVAAASGRGAAVAAQDMPSCGKGRHWDWIVCDEGHKLKNPHAQLPQKVRTLPSSHRLIITGTPIQNHLAELWALYDLCCPGLLGDEVEFRREYSKKIAAGQSRDATQRQRSAGAMASEELRNKCKPFMLRREKSSVLAKAKEEETKEKKNSKRTTRPGRSRDGYRPEHLHRGVNHRMGRGQTRPAAARHQERPHRLAPPAPRPGAPLPRLSQVEHRPVRLKQDGIGAVRHQRPEEDLRPPGALPRHHGDIRRGRRGDEPRRGDENLPVKQVPAPRCRRRRYRRRRGGWGQARSQARRRRRRRRPRGPHRVRPARCPRRLR